MRANTKWSNADYILRKGLTDIPLAGCVMQYKKKPEQHVEKTCKVCIPHHNESRTPPTHKCSTWREVRRTGGQLPVDIPEPEFIADPAHRKKGLRNDLYALLAQKKKFNFGLCEGDILRLCLSYIYMVKQLLKIPRSAWAERSQAPLFHHFDDHRVFETLGLELDASTVHYLEQVDNWRAKRIASRKTSTYRQQRNKKVYAKLLAYHSQLKADRVKNQYYETCTALNEDEPERVSGEPQSKKRKKSKTPVLPPDNQPPAGCALDNWCRACREWGHKRRTSRLCSMNKKLHASHPSLEQLESMPEKEQHKTQQSLLDTIPLDIEDSDECLGAGLVASLLDTAMREDDDEDNA
ncbi:hypothetical protein SEMRO_2543_G330750.1 [Seminavis robusta]|uniref:Uncharacterized protein n=1 Tax=Seminavis robusta TaxID=568900 RepID=A0A9N8F072_9STRA|nr:hypothetical protein SEMRO_2543_G330750.1 [Seminavis robusta]|eukprot:Sro2543_g330750.1 n/a (351) ;mRNA; r:1376-2746